MKRIQIMFLSLVAAFLVSCKTQESNTICATSASTSVASVLADSVVVLDSIFLRETPDTVFYTKYRTIYKERLRCDTLFKCDTVYTVKSVKETVKSSSASLWLWLLLTVSVTVLLWKAGVLDMIRCIITKKR